MLKQLLEPKDEVLSGRLQGVIDIERFADPKRRALESRPRDFLQSTFVSGEIRRLVESINKRLNSTETETGLFLAEGPKGVGKSHGLLSTTTQPAVENVGTSFLPSRQQIRQEVARLLGENEGSRIVSVQVALTFDERTVDVSALPSFLRGSLAGIASFHGESALQFSGVFTKAQVEEMVERLPDFTPGSCRVKLSVQASPE